MSGYSEKKRSLVLRDDPYRGFNGRNRDKPNQSTGWDNRGRFRATGTQVTGSEGHPWTNKGFKGADIGGPFRTEKKYYEEDRSLTPSPLYEFDYTNHNGVNWYYFGPLYAVNPNDVGSAPFPPSAESSDSALDAWGTKAISLCKPTNSIADLSTALGELMREGLPSLLGANLWETKLRDIRASGNEYLNVTFGWLPLVADIRKTAYAVRESDKILSQYERDAGRLVRRTFEFPPEKSIGNVEILYPGGASLGDPYHPEFHTLGQYSPYTTALTTGLGKLTRTRTTEIRRWFSGAFRYYLPTGYDSRSKMARAALLADKLYGVSVDPETLWNLTPWSWALDWVGNIGDVISNTSDFLTDGLVMPYGYMMEHSIVKDTYTRHDLPFKRYGKTTLSLHKITEVKKRRPATPFGFGLTYDGLSTKQKAILAAIGLTRF